jgi:hypothetical protein
MLTHHLSSLLGELIHAEVRMQTGQNLSFTIKSYSPSGESKSLILERGEQKSEKANAFSLRTEGHDGRPGASIVLDP